MIWCVCVLPSAELVSFNVNEVDVMFWFVLRCFNNGQVDHGWEG